MMFTSMQYAATEMRAKVESNEDRNDPLQGCANDDAIKGMKAWMIAMS